MPDDIVTYGYIGGGITILVTVGYIIGGMSLSLLLPIGAILFVIASLGEFAASRDDVSDTGVAGSTASTIEAAGLVALVGFIWYRVDNPIEWAISYWYLVPLAFVLLVGYWYAQNRRQYASAETALDRTKRTASRNISDWASLVTGVLVLVLTVGFAVLQGVGDALAPYAGELAYLATIGLGYLQLGGEWNSQLADLIPSLSPMEWVGISLFLGGMALYIRHQA